LHNGKSECKGTYVTNVVAEAGEEESGHIWLGEVLGCVHIEEDVVEDSGYIGGVEEGVVIGGEVTPVDIDDKVEELTLSDIEALDEVEFDKHGEDDAIDLWESVVPDIEVVVHWLELAGEEPQHDLVGDVGGRKGREEAHTDTQRRCCCQLIIRVGGFFGLRAMGEGMKGREDGRRGDGGLCVGYGRAMEGRRRELQREVLFFLLWKTRGRRGRRREVGGRGVIFE
jgi:hypothetical protein